MDDSIGGGRRKLSSSAHHTPSGGGLARKYSSNRKLSRADRVVQEIFHTKVKDPPATPVEKLQLHQHQHQQQQQHHFGGLAPMKHSSIPFNVSLHPFWPFMHLGGTDCEWTISLLVGTDCQCQNSPHFLEGDDVGTLLTSQLNEEDDAKTGLNCPQKVLKLIKIMVPHVVLVAVLIGYLCLGAGILQALETRTELMARSRKLIRLDQLIENFTESSWHMLVDRFGADAQMHREQWADIFRDYMISVAAEVDDRRPIRQEMLAPEQIDNIHNKWTFPTALLYVLTVLTTCGYSEVSVNTDLGKIFSVIFALKVLYEFFCIHKIGGKYRRKSIQSATTSMGAVALDMLEGMDQIDEPTNLWFPIGAYVMCICVYCSIGSFMFMNWEEKWSFIHSFHFGFNLIVTVGLGDLVVTDYIFLCLIVAFVIVGLAVVTMCVDLASTHLKAYFTSLHYFGRAKRFLGMSEELREIVTLLGVLRRKKHGKITWDDVCNFLENELYNRPFEPHELLMKLRFIDENTLSSALSTMRHNSFQSDFLRDAEYLRRLRALRPDQPAYL
ncbi:hypothetical protein niasHT_038361 [Heterodera trifolii]|uniref:Potassium channel domain-containing protein n=1 Tax=Heterodera trifolii TaxID=157864 RepID=A0ABD2IWZ9_9BILA